MIGRTLGHYRITAAIGAGGMGEVYRATDTKLSRDVALKVLPAEMAVDPDRLERFQREARALAALDHPGIVSVFSVDEAHGTASIEVSFGLTLHGESKSGPEKRQMSKRREEQTADSRGAICCAPCRI